MLLKTHLAFAVLVFLLFVQHVPNKLIFAGMILVATILPDLDSSYSSFGRHVVFKPLQFFVKHRGIIHSFTTGILLSVILAIFWPIFSFGFFIGYSVHLVGDSFTREGIQPFWPLKVKSTGPIYTGGRIEESLFFSLIFVDFVVLLFVFIF